MTSENISKEALIECVNPRVVSLVLERGEQFAAGVFYGLVAANQLTAAEVTDIAERLAVRLDKPPHVRNR